MKFRSILLASHGTAGAKAAEHAAFDLCAAGGRLHHLAVVPDFWKGMMGDDWLNTPATQARFGRYVENTLAREIAGHAEELAAEADRRGVTFSHEFQLGKPADCLIAVAGADTYDLAVIGAPRPKGVAGYRSRMAVEPLLRALSVPLLVVPWPR